MKRFLSIALLALAFTGPLSLPVFADEAPASTATAVEVSPAPEAPALEPAPEAPQAPIIEQSDLDSLGKAINGLAGGGAMAIAFLVAQILMLLAKGSLGAKFTGAWQLVTVSGLTMICGVLSLCIVGKLDLGAALVHSSTLTAFSVFANQVVQKLIAKKA